MAARWIDWEVTGTGESVAKREMVVAAAGVCDLERRESVGGEDTVRGTN